MLLTNATVDSNGSLSAPLPVDKAVACVILGLACVIGIPGNLIVIWTILVNVKRRSSTLMLILTLAVADLVMLVTLPFWIYSLGDGWVFGLVFWKLSVYLIFTSMYSSVFLITAMSVERLVGVLQPFVIQKWQQKGAVRKVIVCILLLSFLLAVPNVTLEIKLDAKGRPLQRMHSSARQEMGFLLLEALVGFLLPFTTLSISYSAISQRIKQMTCQSKSRAGKLIASIVISFVLCWLPYHAVNLIRVTSLSTMHWNAALADRLGQVYRATKDAVGALAFISSCINPILYAFAARNFKTGLKVPNLIKVFEQMNGSFKERRDKESIDNEHRSESADRLKLRDALLKPIPTFPSGADTEKLAGI
ncbi:leukotriene B4 receptor 1-like [Narcine bancroftii]|uniref:leukotriene B4 receptor 1-like n=1 Tax=Narcine bancroftii TaxID=1343680 RepID=UPI003831ECAA